ncbi:MAG: hypothetical protein HC896_14600 [Bacteroidales bacterium]|nr:hypothetical protein [Bacteroidales bacterium]
MARIIFGGFNHGGGCHEKSHKWKSKDKYAAGYQKWKYYDEYWKEQGKADFESYVAGRTRETGEKV